MKKAILIVSYGTSNVAAIKQSIDPLKEQIKKSYPDYSVCLAFSSFTIRKKLQQDNHLLIPSVDEAIMDLIQTQTKELIVLPTYLLPGHSFESMCEQLESYRTYFDTFLCHAPLLSKFKDSPELLSFLVDSKQQRSKNTAVLYVGHGTDHQSNRFYKQLETKFHQQQFTNHFIVTIEDIYDLSSMYETFQTAQYTTILIRPLLFVSGHHAKKDLCSLSEKLMDYGFLIQIDFRGLGEYKEFIQLITANITNSRSI